VLVVRELRPRRHLEQHREQPGVAVDEQRLLLDAREHGLFPGQRSDVDEAAGERRERGVAFGVGGLGGHDVLAGL